MCEIVEEFVFKVDYREATNGVIIKDGLARDYSSTFIIANDMQNSSAELNLLKTLYFAFTSLTTVGFGDFVPK